MKSLFLNYFFDVVLNWHHRWESKIFLLKIYFFRENKTIFFWPIPEIILFIPIWRIGPRPFGRFELVTWKRLHIPYLKKKIIFFVKANFFFFLNLPELERLEYPDELFREEVSKDSITFKGWNSLTSIGLVARASWNGDCKKFKNYI